MAVSTKAKTTSVFDLKSAALTVLALLLKTPDLTLLAEALQSRFGDTPGLFDREPVCVDLSALRESEAALDFEALITLLRGHGFNPMAARGGNPEQMAAALAAGLAEAPDTAPVRESARPAAAVEPAPAPEPESAPPEADLAETAQASPVSALAAPAAEASPAPAAALADSPPQGELALEPRFDPEIRPEPPEPPEPFVMERTSVSTAPTLIIDKPLRSGQQVYARGADLIVLAVVSFGAEVIADGHIHVYAPLRGRALAGARGNTQARIFATCMEPQLVSIAGTYRTTEAGLPEGVAGQPAQVRLEGDKLIFEPLKL